jgi:hypothetical protein
VPDDFVLYGGTGLALQFYGDGTLDQVPPAMQRDLTRWAQAVETAEFPGAFLTARSESGRTGAMTLASPYPPELVRVARKVSGSMCRSGR